MGRCPCLVLPRPLCPGSPGWGRGIAQHLLQGPCPVLEVSCSYFKNAWELFILLDNGPVSVRTGKVSSPGVPGVEGRARVCEARGGCMSRRTLGSALMSAVREPLRSVCKFCRSLFFFWKGLEVSATGDLKMNLYLMDQGEWNTPDLS